MRKNYLSSLIPTEAITTCIVLFTVGTLTACDSLLDVELPARLTDEALEDPAAAEQLVESSIAIFECGYSSLALQAMGHEDVWERLAGSAPAMQYATSPGSGGSCDADAEDSNWYVYVHTSRSTAERVYDRLSNEWSDEVDDKEEFQAIVALYAAANTSVLGEFFCEMALDGGELLSPEQTLAEAEQWIEKAFQHIGTNGDFEMPAGIAPSAETMAHALRARIRWAKGDYGGALADAERVPQGFNAWVTRGVAHQRRNKVAVSGFTVPFGGLLDVVDWWGGSRPNPATGETWPSPIPFTGYVNLGVLDDGRAIRNDGIPIRTSVESGADADVRVPHVFKETVAGQPAEVQAKYTEDDDFLPLVSWREMWLIRAEVVGGQNAIDLVNDLRNHHDLPQVTYVDPSNEEEIRHLILEERRRELWLEGGRWWSTKIQNTDLLWFPRDEGEFPAGLGFELQGGVRMIMPDSEYDNNDNLTRQDRATMCEPAERPVNF